MIESFFSQISGIGPYGVMVLPKAAPSADALRSWIDKGYHGGLMYMEETVEKRVSPGEFAFPWAKSIILFAFPYPVSWGTSEEYQHGMDDTSKSIHIARYARGLDYHHRAHQILSELKEHLSIQSPSDFNFQGFVDSSPVFERDLAALMGLGWRAKNTCLINPELGSGFFLAGAVTNISLEEKKTLQTDHCGTCTRCIDACPTHALIKPGVLDANRCISTWTIEKSGEIPAEVAQNLSGRIFGCDICQEVCPWNQSRAEKHSDWVKYFWGGSAEKLNGTAEQQNFNAPLHLFDSDTSVDSLISWLNVLVRGGGVQKHIRGTALMRAGRKKLLRNLLYHMINLKQSGLYIDDDQQRLQKALFRLREVEEDPTILKLVGQL